MCNLSNFDVSPKLLREKWRDGALRHFSSLQGAGGNCVDLYH